MKYKPYSPSKILLYKQCPKRFKYQYIDKVVVEEKPRTALEKGSLIHEILEANLKGKLFQLNKKQYEALTESDYINVENIINNFITTETFLNIKNSTNKLLVEKFLRLDKDLNPTLEKEKSILNGKIDAIIHNDKIGLVIDWKTGGKDKATIERFPKDEEQLEIYAIWALQVFKLDGIKTKYIYVEHDAIQEKVILKKDLELLKSKYLNMLNEIENCNTWTMNVGLLCSYCDYVDLCKLHE